MSATDRLCAKSSAEADPLFLHVSASRLITALRTALAALPSAPVRLAVGLSGGIDSTMLAVTATELARESSIPLCFFHVHHGLQVAADDWARQVQALGALLTVSVYEARAKISELAGQGIEAAAREARYQAFVNLAHEHQVDHILLAHHRDDQAETVLLRLLRGAGVQGMAAMAPHTRRDGVVYVRPWLEIDRCHILAAGEHFAYIHDWFAVNDPTNSDPCYTRAAVRTVLTPVLNQRWPGWQVIVARHARQMADAAEILAEVAHADLNSLDLADEGRSFSLAKWRGLSRARQVQVLRYWLATQGTRMPSDARLSNLSRQLMQLHSLGHDRLMKVEHAGHVIYCHRGRVWIDTLRR